MHEPKVYITVGTTSCGKSTWAKKMAKEQDFKIIAGDALREMTYGQYVYRPGLEGMLKDSALMMAYKWNTLHGNDVILDDAVWFLTPEKRSEVTGYIPSTHITWVCFPVPTDEQVRQRRANDLRGISLDTWVDIVHQHQKELIYPRGQNVVHMESW